ncbi:unnamed protein product, partial [Brugia timori]|uniref:Uncharacterized protein n=1 Tax=Brugia timori TaxID=42155 RepID=A0A0R3QPC4_9BILA
PRTSKRHNLNYFSKNRTVNDSVAFLGSFSRNQSEPDSTESPASPPHEPGVFVATAPKIISDYDMRSAIDASFQMPARQYRPPEVTPFTAVASIEAVKNPELLTDKKQKNLAINDEPTYILPELVSFPSHSIQRNPAESEKKDSLLNPPAQHLQWNVFPNSDVDDHDLSFWKTNESIASGDVDMRAIHSVSTVPDTSREVIVSAAHHVRSVMQAPIVFSNGDTDHRMISSAVRPSTSAHSPESFTNESTGRLRMHHFSSLTSVPYAGSFRYSSTTPTSYTARFKHPRVYGFFNQPTIHRQSKPYYARGGSEAFPDDSGAFFELEGKWFQFLVGQTTYTSQADFDFGWNYSKYKASRNPITK